MLSFPLASSSVLDMLLQLLLPAELLLRAIVLYVCLIFTGAKVYFEAEAGQQRANVQFWADTAVAAARVTIMP